MVNAKLKIDGQVGSQVPSANIAVTDNLAFEISTLLPAAQPGTITSSTVTMTNANHGIATGNTVDAFWTDTGGVARCRYGCTVGTVAGTSVPLSGGAGDALPTGGAAIVLGLETAFNVGLPGSDVSLLLIGASTSGHCQIQNGAGTALVHQVIGSGAPVLWWSGQGITNPLAGQTVAKIILSNADVAAGNAITGGITYSGS